MKLLGDYVDLETLWTPPDNVLRTGSQAQRDHTLSAAGEGISAAFYLRVTQLKKNFDCQFLWVTGIPDRAD
jgi:hypothetical protein